MYNSLWSLSCGAKYVLFAIIGKGLKKGRVFDSAITSMVVMSRKVCLHIRLIMKLKA